jgi:hypothetical protein
MVVILITAGRTRGSRKSKARGPAGANGLAARRTIFEHQSDGVGHDERRALILSVNDDFRKGGHRDGKAALFFWLQHHGEGAYDPI